MNFIVVAAVLVSAVVSFLLGWLLRQRLGQKKLSQASLLAEKYLEDAKVEGESLKREKLLEAKEERFQLKQQIEKENKSRQVELQRLEKQLSNREMNLDRKVDILNKKESELSQKLEGLSIRETQLGKQEAELERLLQEENSRLERLSGLTTEEAMRIQMQNMLDKARDETALEIREIREAAKRTARNDSREIMIQAIQRCSIGHVVDTTVSPVELPDDEMKGRIIGREGRNIRAFESATGIEVLIDDTPRTVVLSCFDPVRREVAKQALEKLIYDGRIHPGRIEEVVEKSKEEVAEKMLEIGEQTMQDIGLPALHHELIRLLGKQHFRTTYGQNLLQHSREVAMLAGEMASQLGLDVTLAKRAGLLHDIGKVAEDYSDAPFYEIGPELAKKYGENEKVQNAIAHQAPFDRDLEVISPITVLTKLADSISVSRRGAQKEMLADYLKRMDRLEEIAMEFPGVVKSFAIQAGRELRVIAEHAMVDDERAQILADDIVRKLRAELQFPGQIKVTVIREFRSFDYAK